MSRHKAAPSQPPRLQVAEPAGAYDRRAPVVVDASILAAILFGEDRHGFAATFLQISALSAPHLIDCEIASVALKKLRREGQTADRVSKALQIYAELDITRHAVDAAAITGLADRYALSAYDAAYLWLAQALSAPLATLDDKLAKAARLHLGASPPGNT